jgi:hypothetical protein
MRGRENAMMMETKEVATVYPSKKGSLARLKRLLKTQEYDLEDGSARGAQESGGYQWTLDMKALSGLPWGEELNQKTNSEADRIASIVTIETDDDDIREAIGFFTGDGEVIVRLPFDAVGFMDTRTYRRRR